MELSKEPCVLESRFCRRVLTPTRMPTVMPVRCMHPQGVCVCSDACPLYEPTRCVCVCAGALGPRHARLNKPASSAIWEVCVAGFLCPCLHVPHMYRALHTCGYMAGVLGRASLPWASSQRSSLYIATASQAFAKSPLSLVTCNLEALVTHRDEVILW